jgi:FkbM family methyltransferase
LKPPATHLIRLRPVLRAMLPRPIIAVLKAAWADYSFDAFKRRVVRHRYGAYELQMELVDFDGALWFDKDYPASAFAEIEMLKRHRLVAGAKVFNAGANQFLQAIMMAKEVEPGGLVVAVEPNARNVRAGRKNCELNSVPNIEVVEAAVSSVPGTLWFNRSMNGQVAGKREAGARPVEAVTIDGLSEKFGRPDVLYIDVEGFECEVLKGARATIETWAPDCFVEAHLRMGLERQGGSVEKICSSFPRKTYQLYYSDGHDGLFRRVEEDTRLPARRFYLLAMARDDALSVSKQIVP